MTARLGLAPAPPLRGSTRSHMRARRGVTRKSILQPPSLSLGGGESLPLRFAFGRTHPGSNCMIIAIDGPAASGKGTLGKRVASYYGLAHLDTGTLYRAVARDVLARGEDPADSCAAASAARALDPRLWPIQACGPGARRDRLGGCPPCRGARGAARLSAGLRAPQARRRARRARYRHRHLPRSRREAVRHRDARGARTPPFSRAQAEWDGGHRGRRAADIRRRDERDKNRDAAPLRKAEDAVLLDTTNLDIDAAFRAAIELIDAALVRAGQAV